MNNAGDIDFSIYHGKSEDEITKILGYVNNKEEVIEVLKCLNILSDDYCYLRSVICMDTIKDIDDEWDERFYKMVENNLPKQ